MAKKINPPEAPIITKLPLPNSENALVIDLPDGQKLVVGKMATGTVIEVATWRGTGRPDSRTTRLMLGVTSQEANASVSADGATAAVPEKKGVIDEIKALWTQGLKKAVELLQKVKTFKAIKNVKIKKAKNSESESKTEAVYTRISEPSDDVQAWLDSITAKSEKKAESKAIIKAVAKKSAVPRKAAPKKSTGTRGSK